MSRVRHRIETITDGVGFLKELESERKNVELRMIELIDETL